MNSKEFGDVDDFRCSAGPGGWPAEAKPGKMSSWPAGAEALLFITFIIVAVANPCIPIRDPNSTSGGPRAAFIIYYIYYFYYCDNEFIIFIIFITLIHQNNLKTIRGGALICTAPAPSPRTAG